MVHDSHVSDCDVSGLTVNVGSDDSSRRRIEAIPRTQLHFHNVLLTSLSNLPESLVKV